MANVLRSFLGLAIGLALASAQAAPEATPIPSSSPAPAPQKQSLAPNAIYIEGLGAGIAYSINYERLVIEDLALRIGFSYLSLGRSINEASGGQITEAKIFTFPLTLSYLGVRSRSNALELGGGATLVYASGTGSGFGLSASGSGVAPIGTVLVGYRYHPFGGAGLQFRIGAMALMGKGLSLSKEVNPEKGSDPTQFGIIPWLYLSLGAAF